MKGAVKPNLVINLTEKEINNIMETLNAKGEIKSDFYKSLGSVTKLLLDITLIELLKSLSENIQKIKKLLVDTDDYYFEKYNLIYDEKILTSLAEANVDEAFITTLLTNIKEDSVADLSIDLTDILQAMEDFIKDEFKDYLFLEHNPFDNYISLIGKNLDFIFDYAQDMNSALRLIEESNAPNKEKMLEITFFSYARTTTTCVESASKEFIRSAYQICHLHILKKIINNKDSKQSISALFKRELDNAANKGMGSIEKLLEDFFNFSRVISSTTTSDKFKTSFITFKNFVVKRNKIIHEDAHNIEDFNFIINNYEVCNDFLSDVLKEYVTGESQDTLIEDIMTLCSEMAQNHSNILEELYPQVKAHIPF